MQEDRLEGLLVLDKPAGLTSQETLDRLKRMLPKGTRMGHTGTLDPLATGVLVACLGNATRLSEYVQKMDKSYRSTFRLGVTSDTDDAAGNVVAAMDPVIPGLNEIRETVSGFIGEIDQVPPIFSATWVDGKRAYDLARKGREFSLDARRITIYRIEILKYDWPLLELEIDCAKGTYIRSLARDLGAILGCGGIVDTLRRIRIGHFDESMASSPDSLQETILSQIRPVHEALMALPRFVLSVENGLRLSHGQKIMLNEKSRPPGLGQVICSVFDESNRFVGVGKWDQASGILRAEKIWKDARFLKHP